MAAQRSTGTSLVLLVLFAAYIFATVWFLVKFFQAYGDDDTNGMVFYGFLLVFMGLGGGRASSR